MFVNARERDECTGEKGTRVRVSVCGCGRVMRACVCVCTCVSEIYESEMFTRTPGEQVNGSGKSSSSPI